MKNILKLLIFFISSSVFAQVPTVDFSFTPTQLVQDVLAGPGVQISNVKFNDNANYTGKQIAKFNYAGNQIAFGSGIVMGSGYVATNNTGTSGGIIGPNNTAEGTFPAASFWTGVSIPAAENIRSDAQLQQYDYNNNGIENVGRLEFDFIPTGNKVKFEFIFGSEEYNAYVCSDFYDLFGFFVTGPNPAGGNYTNRNFAIVPGTTLPISINTINNGSVGAEGSSSDCVTGGMSNSQYYAGAPGAHFQMNGATKAMEIEFNVICGETYHFKFAIADASDELLDSWVFLKAGSFSSDAAQVTVASVSGSTSIVEGCSTAEFLFTRPADAADTALTIRYEISGSAIEGQDFDPLVNPITFAPGQDSLYLSFVPIQDGIAEGLDSVIIRVFLVNECGDTIVSQGIVYIIDEPNIEIAETDPTVFCSNDLIPISAVASGGQAPYTYTWNNGATGSNINVATSLNGPFEYYVTATDICGYSKTDTVTITLNQTLRIDTLISLPTTACLNTGTVSAVISGISGTPTYSWNATSFTGPQISNTTIGTNVGAGWHYFTVTDNICTEKDSVFVDPINPPTAVINPDKTSGCNPTKFTLDNNSLHSSTYLWNTGNGYYTVNSLAAQEVTLSSTSTIYLIATDGTCSDTTSVTLTIVNCGCTDPIALNYDANAVLEDGSCQYEDPVIELPNVFSPNGDNVNDEYTFKKLHLVSIQYWIFNRWGNLMFETNQLDKYWNGKSNGKDASEGVYFIKYRAVGINGKEFEGHSFFHLER